MRILILVLSYTAFLFAQYDSTMVDLIKTTYQRSFNKQIIYSYLNSDSDKKIKAALLSISQSEDTSFVPDLIKMDLNKFGSEVCFALGQIGSCEQTIAFLWNYLTTSPPSHQFPDILFALGKTGDIKDLNKLVTFYNSFVDNNFTYQGISEAVLQFHLRGIKSDDAKSVLEKEVHISTNDIKRKSDALFVLARYGGSDKIINDIKNILQKPNTLKSQLSEKASSSEMFNIIVKQYALMNLQRLKYFPSEVNLLKPLFENDDILLSIELAKSIIYFDFDQKNTNLLPSVFKILDEPNLNFAIQAAVSIKDIDTSYLNKSKSFVRRRILETLSDPKKNDRLKSEVFLTGYKILGDYTDFSNLINWFNADDILKIKFEAFNPDTALALERLVEFYNSVELKNKIEALTQLLNFSKSNSFSAEYTQIILDAISSRYPPLISIAADGIDSDFINDNSNRLKESVSNQIITYKDNPDFIESMISLINLSEKIDTVFFNQMISKAKSSALYSLRKFISNKTNENISGVKELDQFDNIWQYGFRYSGAVINTSKGSISLEFNSELAPISVANFCRLADENFYDGIIFHRVVPGFVIQSGDPTATGWGGPGYDIISESSDTEFEIGQVGMASAGKDTEGSQFFIMQGSYPHLNSRYSLFAKVLDGMEVVYNIIEGDKILSVQLIK